MKKLVAILSIVCILLAGCTSDIEPNIIQTAESPNGKYVAYIFEWNMGATTPFIYRLSVLKKGHKLKNGDKGNAYISNEDFNVKWDDNDTLTVDNQDAVRIHKQETEVSGIEIVYSK